MTLQLVIADDHHLIREGFKRILAPAADVHIAAEFADGDSLLAGIGAVTCDVLLLDISMPGADGTSLIRELREAYPALAILVVSMHNDPQIVRRALQAGASGYVDKGCSTEMLMTAVQAVAAGARFIDPCLMDSLLQEPTLPKSLHHQLSRRETEILRLVGAGHSGAEIAEQLHLSPKTVSTHKRRLMQKLNVTNIAALIQYAMAHDLFN